MLGQLVYLKQCMLNPELKCPPAIPNDYSSIRGALESISLDVRSAAAVAAIVGLFAYEDAFVRAGQSVPLS